MRWLLLVGALAVTWACDDEASGDGAGDAMPPRDARVKLDMGPPPTPDAAIEVDAGPLPDAAPPEPDAAPPGPEWVEVELAQWRRVFSLDDAPVATGAAFDRYGDALDVELVWSVVPPGIARVEPNGALTFTGEGQGAVVACAGAAPCGRASFYVDAGPPTLLISAPERGAILGGDAGRTLTVSGTATDTGHPVSVRVNGERVDVGEGGAFSIDLPARFGTNLIEVTADDGVQAAVRDQREVLWAPRFTRVDPAAARIPGALVVQLDQAMLDADTPVAVPDGAGRIQLAEIAQLLDLLVQLVDVEDLLDDPQLSDNPAFSLRIEGVDLGPAEVELGVVPGGLGLFLRLGDIQVETRGALVLEGEDVSLDGSLQASVAAFATLSVGLDGGLTVTLVDNDVVVESVEGRFADPTATVLVSTLGTQLRNLVVDLAGDLVSDLFAEQLPALLETGLGGLLSAFERIPLNLAGLEGLPPVRLELSLTPSAIETAPDAHLRVVLDGRVSSPMPLVAPHEDPGVATLSPDADVVVPGEGLGLTVRLGLINAILHELWRSGLLSAEAPLPDDLLGVLGSVQLDARLPPLVAPADPFAERPLEAQLGELRMTIAGRDPEDEPDVYALSLRVGLGVSMAEGALTLSIDDAPQVGAVLLSRGADRPILSADGLATLVTSVVWPLVQDALGGGLSFGLSPVEVAAEEIQQIAPRIRRLTIGPQFPAEPWLDDGRLRLEGGLSVGIDLTD